MAKEKELILRLANGKEESFRDGYDMWAWFAAQKGLRADDGKDEAARADSPVVQRRRRLPHTQETMVRVHPGLLSFVQRSPRCANRQSGSA